MPAVKGDAVGDAVGAGFARCSTPTWLLYRMLLGSAFANIGASASVVTAHSVAGAAVGEGEVDRIVGKGVVVGVGEGEGLRPYTLQDVVTLRPRLAALLADIQVLGSLFPWRKE